MGAVDIDEQLELGRRRRLAEEMLDELPQRAASAAADEVVVAEVVHALRPPRHERRIPTYGAIVHPATPLDEWSAVTGLAVTTETPDVGAPATARRFADGLASWLVVEDPASPRLVVFDRPVASERDVVIVAAASGGTVVQRHPGGLVRVAGEFGVIRTDGLSWHLEPPVDTWLDQTCRHRPGIADGVLEAAIAFAVHDLGANGTGATLVIHPNDADPSLLGAGTTHDPEPPPLRLGSAPDLAPLRHVLVQLDGASLFDGTGTLCALGAHLVPSRLAEATVARVGGTRHTSARRFSHDHPTAVVVTVSEDGPVTVFEAGEVAASSSSAVR
jgi:hypothetical protein